MVALRILHILELERAKKPLEYALEIVMPNNRIGRLNLSAIIKFVYFILIGVHYLICLWILIGSKYLMSDSNVPWLLKTPDLGTGDAYIFVFYWIFTIITTVGYGDFVGGTTAEYLVTIVIEFAGLVVFTVLTLLVN